MVLFRINSVQEVPLWQHQWASYEMHGSTFCGWWLLACIRSFVVLCQKQVNPSVVAAHMLEATSGTVQCLAVVSIVRAYFRMKQKVGQMVFGTLFQIAWQAYYALFPRMCGVLVVCLRVPARFGAVQAFALADDCWGVVSVALITAATTRPTPWQFRFNRI